MTDGLAQRRNLLAAGQQLVSAHLTGFDVAVSDVLQSPPDVHGTKRLRTGAVNSLRPAPLSGGFGRGQVSVASPGRSARFLVPALSLFAAAVIVPFVFGDEVSRLAVDLNVYRAGAEAVRHVDPLYAEHMPSNGLAFTYPVSLR